MRRPVTHLQENNVWHNSFPWFASEEEEKEMMRRVGAKRKISLLEINIGTQQKNHLIGLERSNRNIKFYRRAMSSGPQLTQGQDPSYGSKKAAKEEAQPRRTTRNE